MKLISWNVNGIRAWYKKGAMEELLKEKPDIFCFQETKAHPEQLPEELRNIPGYISYFDHSKVKKGYSGVAIYLSDKLLSLRPDLKSPKRSGLLLNNFPLDYGFGIPELDQEGRFLSIHLKDFTIITCYFPNGGGGPHRLEYKMKFYDAFFTYIEKLKKKQPNIIFCGDVNTAHNEIDLSRPKENEKSTGFLRTERDWIDKIIKKGWIDSFRHLHPKKIQYSWWDMKTFARARNIGWRIDYFFVSPALENKIKKAEILDQMLGSDHCPISIDISL
jgi:exodeoxyribonuclease-3